jgi:hypothetical protein
VFRAVGRCPRLQALADGRLSTDEFTAILNQASFPAWPDHGKRLQQQVHSERTANYR